MMIYMIIMRTRDDEETPTKMTTTLSEIKRFTTMTEKKLMKERKKKR